jgi:serine/threonine protein kinase
MDSDRPRLGDERYRLIEEVGSGAIATVWRAVEQEGGAQVAIKLMRAEQLDLEDVQRLAQEVEILRRLKHPCIVKLYGTGVAESGNPYVVMEWIDGIDLRQRLEGASPLPFADVADIVNQICCALAEAHDAGVVHRDLKPENVLLCAPEHLAVKLVDFGMAKLLAPEAPSLTFDDRVFGTPAYMAPERARGRRVGAAADLYSVAVMAYEMLEGQRPFGGKHPIQVMTQQVMDPPPPMQRAPDEAAQVVLGALAKDPADRPTVLDFARRLAGALTEATPRG